MSQSVEQKVEQSREEQKVEQSREEQKVAQSREQEVEQQSEEKPVLLNYPLNPNLRQALVDYLGGRPYGEVAHLVEGLSEESVPGEVIVDISRMLQQERPVRLMQGLQVNVQQVNQIRAQAATSQQKQQEGSTEKESEVVEEESVVVEAAPQ